MSTEILAVFALPAPSMADGKCKCKDSRTLTSIHAPADRLSSVGYL